MTIDASPSAVLLDFDGTICQLFVNYDLQALSRSLHQQMAKLGFDYPAAADPYEVFSLVPEPDDEPKRARALYAAHEMLARAEFDAAETAPLVPGVQEVVSSLRAHGVAIAVVTNNARDAVARVAASRLPALRDVAVIARDPHNLERLKPSPWPVLRAIDELNATASTSCLVGDSLADMRSARAAGCSMVGMGSTPAKRRRLLAKLPRAQVVGDFYGLVRLINTGGWSVSPSDSRVQRHVGSRDDEPV